MRNAYRLRWKTPVGGIAGVHAIGYGSVDEAFDAAVEQSYAMGWDGFTKPEHGPGLRIPSPAENRAQTLAFGLVVAAVVALLLAANAA